MTAAAPSSTLSGNAGATSQNAVIQRLLLVGLFFVPLMADLLAQAPYYGLQTQLYPWTVVGAVVVTGFIGMLLCVTPSREALTLFDSGNARRILMIVCLVPALATFPFMGGTPSVVIRIALLGLGVLFLVLMARNPSSLFPFFMLSVVYSFLQRARFLNAVEIRSEFSDILPLIEQASRNFLAGNMPYVVYDVPPRLPLVYLPGTWSAYLVPLSVGVDMRLANLAAEFGIVLIFLSLVYRFRNNPAVNLAFGYAALLLVLPTSMFWDSFTAHPIWWFWLLVGVRLLIARRFALWAIAMGITLATSQLALVILPVFGLYVLREVGWKRAPLHASLLAGTALLIVAPFAYRDPPGFVNDTMLYYADLKYYGQLLWETDRRWQYILGFGGEAWRLGVPHLLRYAQGAAILILAALYALRYRNSAANSIRVAAATLGLFLLLSAVVWHYYYQAVFYLLLFYVALLTLEARNQDQGVMTA